MMKGSGWFLVCLGTASFCGCASGFVAVRPTTTTTRSHSIRFATPSLFDDEPELWDIAEHYVHAKYQECAQLHGRSSCNQDDIRELLGSLLPPVTPQELEDEVDTTLAIILQNDQNTPDQINQDCFVKALVQNTYWEAAGSLVVKELMYYDALHHYYSGGQTSLLDNDDYEELKDNLTWEGSSVPTMSQHEATFVHAVAASKRGEPVLTDEEYATLKQTLKQQGSWVVEREPDALEKMGLQTFMGYLHTSMSSAKQQKK